MLNERQIKLMPYYLDLSYIIDLFDLNYIGVNDAINKCDELVSNLNKKFYFSKHAKETLLKDLKNIKENQLFGINKFIRYYTRIIEFLDSLCNNKISFSIYVNYLNSYRYNELEKKFNELIDKLQEIFSKEKHLYEKD